jgi:hypothetical protein
MGFVSRRVFLEADAPVKRPNMSNHGISEFSDSECPSPSKKQRNTFEKLAPPYRWQDEHGSERVVQPVPSHLRDLKLGECEEYRNHYSPELLEKHNKLRCEAQFEGLAACSCPPELLMKNWKEKWAAQSNNYIQVEVPLDTEFERDFDRLRYMGEGIMKSLKRHQEWYRKKDQHRIFKSRAKELLDKNWEFDRRSMLHSFEITLRCKNCSKCHLEERFTEKYNRLKASLEGVDSNMVDQGLLDRIKDEAWGMSEEHLAATKASKCHGFKKEWRKKTVDDMCSLGRSDSGVGLKTENAALEMKRL